MPLKLLLIDTDPERARAIEEHRSDFAEIVRAPAGADLPRTVERVCPDLIIVDMALPDHDGLEDLKAGFGGPSDHHVRGLPSVIGCSPTVLRRHIFDPDAMPVTTKPINCALHNV